MQWPHGVTWRHVELELADNGRDGHQRLLQRKDRANTAPRPGAEGHVDVAINARPRERQEPCRIEELGLFPPLAVAMWAPHVS